jgi:hypothetical protein
MASLRRWSRILAMIEKLQHASGEGDEAEGEAGQPS